MAALKIITILLFVLLTILTVKISPEMHQPMLIEPANFKLVRDSDLLMDKNKIPVAAPSSQSKDIEVKVSQPQETQTKYVQTQTPETKSQEKIVYNPQLPKKVQTKPVDNQNTTNQLELLNRIIKQTEQEEHKPQPVQQPAKPVQKPPVTQPVQPPKTSTFKNPYMTEQEEIIAWNKWRSDLQNRIMVDSRIDYAPLGTAFLYSCVIDKYGNVSNIKTWSTNSNFTAAAKSKIKPAIANLQGQPILRFPRGTQRTSTVFTGAFIMGTEDRFSSPSDYSDFERILR